MQYCAEQPCARTSCIILLVFFSDSENVILTFFPNETVHIWLHIPLCLDGAKTDPLCLYIYVGYWLISTIHNICKYVLVMERKSTILHLSPSSLIFLQSWLESLFLQWDCDHHEINFKQHDSQILGCNSGSIIQQVIRCGHKNPSRLKFVAEIF